MGSMANGVDRFNGKRLSGIQHLKQSIVDILTTPIGSRVMRRDYGSRLYQLIDAPINRETIIDIISAVAEALLRWEPRIRLNRVILSNIDLGSIHLTLQGQYLPNGKPITLDGIVI